MTKVSTSTRIDLDSGLKVFDQENSDSCDIYNFLNIYKLIIKWSIYSLFAGRKVGYFSRSGSKFFSWRPGKSDLWLSLWKNNLSKWIKGPRLTNRDYLKDTIFLVLLAAKLLSKFQNFLFIFEKVLASLILVTLF